MRIIWVWGLLLLISGLSYTSSFAHAADAPDMRSGVLVDYAMPEATELQSLLIRPMLSDPTLRVELRVYVRDAKATGTAGRKMALTRGLEYKEKLIKAGISPRRIDVRPLLAPLSAPSHGLRVEYTLRVQAMAPSAPP